MNEIFIDMQQVEKYAGTAFCNEGEEKSESKFWLGQYKALKRIYNKVENHWLKLEIEKKK